MDKTHDPSQLWRIGDTILTAVVETHTPGIPVELFFPDASASDVMSAGEMPDGAVGDDGTIAFRVQSFVLQHQQKLIVVDPCVGNCKRRSLPFWNELHGPWMDRFLEAGFGPAEVDLVIHTHLHEDHLGWDTQLVDGQWVPTFTNAKHVYVGDELDWARSGERRTDQDSFADSIAPVLDAGLGWEVTPNTDLGDGLALMSTPGHTPGHASLVVSTTAETLIITGDLVHHPFQLAHPLIAEIGDCDPGLAARTRRDFFSQQATSGTLLAGTHFPGAPLGRIENRDRGWRFVPERADAPGSPVSRQTPTQ